MGHFSKVKRTLEERGYSWHSEKLYNYYIHVFREKELLVSCRGLTKTECWKKVRNWLQMETQIQADEEEYCFT